MSFSKRIHIRGFFVKYMIAFLCATALANILCYMYYSPAIQIPNHEKYTDVKNLPGNHNPFYVEGGSNTIIDKNGFNNISNIEMDDAKIVFVGSSQTEGQNVSSEDNFVSLLNNYSPGLNGYNIGVSASTFSSTFFRIQPIKKKFPQAKTLVFEINIMPSYSELEKVREHLATGNIPEKDISWKAGNFFVTNISKVPLVRLLWRQYDHYRAARIKQSHQKDELDTVAYHEILMDVFRLAKHEAKDTRIVVFNLSKTEIRGDGTVDIVPDRGENASFAEACAANGFIYVDMGEPFLKMYHEEKVLPYGFLNTPIGKGHLNEKGHECLAKTLLPILTSEEI